MGYQSIYYKAPDLTKEIDLIAEEQRRQQLRQSAAAKRQALEAKRNGGEKFTPTKVDAAFDKRFFDGRDKLLNDLYTYQKENAAGIKAGDPNTITTVESMKRQIKDFAKFTVNEGSDYATIHENYTSKDDFGNLLYDPSSLAKVPQYITAEDIVGAQSNLQEGESIDYIFGGANPNTTEEGYVYDEEGFLVDESGAKIPMSDKDGNTVSSDSFEIDRRYNTAIDPSLFSFGEGGEVTYDGVPVSNVSEFKFDPNEIQEALKPVDYIGNLSSQIKLGAGAFNPETGSLTSEGKTRAMVEAQRLTTRDANGAYPSTYGNTAMSTIAKQFLMDEEGNDSPREEEIQAVLDNPEAVRAGGANFSEYAPQYVYDVWANEQLSRPRGGGLAINIAGGGKQKDFFYQGVVPQTDRKVANYTVLGTDGAAIPVETFAYAEVPLNSVKTRKTLPLKMFEYNDDGSFKSPGAIFPRAIAGLDNLADRTFTAYTDNVKIHPVNIKTGQHASKEEIESGSPDVVFMPYAVAKAKSNTPMSTEEYVKTLSSIPQEQRTSFDQLRDMLTKSDKEVEILVPLEDMFTAKELEQFKGFFGSAEQMNADYQKQVQEQEGVEDPYEKYKRK